MKSVAIKSEDWVWFIGLELLRRYDIGDMQARSLIGKWVKACHRDKAKLEGILRSAGQEPRGDIIEYVTAALPKNGTANRAVEEAKAKAAAYNILSGRVHMAMKGFTSQNELQVKDWRQAANWGIIPTEQAKQLCRNQWGRSF